jgi:hypothetical protein
MGTGAWIGTHVFVSMRSAINYYLDYGFYAYHVREKIQAGEVLIGRIKKVKGIDTCIREGRWYYRKDDH